VTGARAPDVVIVGAGIVGAACADALSEAGLLVEVVDAGFAGGGTTGAGMGHVVVMDDSPAQLALTAWSRSRWSALAEEMPAWCELARAGTMWIAAEAGEMEGVAAKRATYERAGVASEILDARALAAAEPSLRPGLAGALRVPDDLILYPPAAARWLLERAAARGARRRERCEVTAIDAGRVMLRDGAGATATISCGAVVNAAGIDAPRLAAGLPVIPRKGHLVIPDRDP
jgi:glycine/D-amino acid oxidase-like deaminating enzyme